MSVPAASEKYSPPSTRYPDASPKPPAWRAIAPGTSILTGISFLVMCMRRHPSVRPTWTVKHDRASDPLQDSDETLATPLQGARGQQVAGRAIAAAPRWSHKAGQGNSVSVPCSAASEVSKVGNPDGASS